LPGGRAVPHRRAGPDAVRPLSRGAACPDEPPTKQINPQCVAQRVDANRSRWTDRWRTYASPAGQKREAWCMIQARKRWELSLKVHQGHLARRAAASLNAVSPAGTGEARPDGCASCPGGQAIDRGPRMDRGPQGRAWIEARRAARAVAAERKAAPGPWQALREKTHVRPSSGVHRPAWPTCARSGGSPMYSSVLTSSLGTANASATATGRGGAVIIC
jgi:hypothetical protein